MREYLEKESMDKKKKPFDTSEWTDFMPKDCPVQNNGYDCGVFTCL
jgi:sentrin-specific protease 1